MSSGSFESFPRMDRRKHTNLAHQVLNELGRRIAIGEHAPGIALPPEGDLIREFGTSRTVIREAVKMLTAKGLVSTRPRRGTIVLPESNWNLADPDILDWLLHRRNVLPLILEFVEIRLANQVKGVSLASIEEHERIHAAISAGDAVLAESRMRTLILDARAFLERANELRNGADDADLEARAS